MCLCASNQHFNNFLWKIDVLIAVGCSGNGGILLKSGFTQLYSIFKRIFPFVFENKKYVNFKFDRLPVGPPCLG